ncbi:DUF975 family protein [Priestia megaterium]|uniref:DUF975 family protein n=1 Tax=Priestia megaterium TaxID=1404 RepID=UPI002E241EB5|nr:DUF975 family protein [Priestia megaterium]
MKIKTLKLKAKEKLKENKKMLYKTAGLYLLFYVIVLALSAWINVYSEDLADLFHSVGLFFIFPILFANIAIIVSSEKKSNEKITGFHFYKNNRLVKTLLTRFIPSFFVFLWILPVCFLLGIGIAVFYEAKTTIFAAVVVLLVLALLVISIYKSLQYSLTSYIVAENTIISPYDALKESKKLTKGNIRKLFLLNLSFIGWVILIPFSLTLVCIYLIPYYNASIFEFYTSLKAKDDLSDVSIETLSKDILKEEEVRKINNEEKPDNEA